MKLHRIWAACLIITVSLGAGLQAQNNAGGGGGQAGGGQGGGGRGGLPGGAGPGANPGAANPGVKAPGQNADQFANPTGLYAQGYTPNPWFINPALAQQLKFNPAAVEQLRNNYQTSWQRYQEQLQNLPQDLPEEQLRQRQLEMAQAFQNDFNGALPKAIPEETQRQRFQQLMLQYRGLNAFEDPTLVQQLRLTPEQRQQVNRMQREWRRMIAQLNRGNGNLPRDFDWNEFYRRTNLSIDEILTPEQLQLWRRLRGEEFSFPPDVYYGHPAKVQGQQP